ncbi:MAG: alpha/beta hydrolase [Bacteroidota bacterium]
MKYFTTIFCVMITTWSLANEFHGYWKGDFMFKGSGWPMRMQIVQADDSLFAAVDFPSLVLAEMEIPARVNKDTLIVEMPFGVGTYHFQRKADQLTPVGKSKNLTFRKCPKPPYQIESISWESGDQILHGSLYLPDSSSRHPLLIRLHGSGTGNRSHWEYRSWGDYFARQGIATVVFDRRESGDFELLAKDAVALIKAMKKRHDIDPNNIILNGGSQAAYIGFMANSLCDDVDYLLLSGVPAVSLIEQERQSLIHRMRRNEEPQHEIDQAVGYQNLYFHYVMTGNNWSDLQKAAIEAQNTKWAKYTDQPQKAEDMQWWRKNFNAFQPQVVIPKVRIPVLILYGEQDAITPPSENIFHLKRYFDLAANSEYQIKICPAVGHSLEVGMGYDRWGTLVFPQRSPAMFEAIERWLDRYGLRN